MKRQAMLIEREDGRREHSPEVEIIDDLALDEIAAAEVRSTDTAKGSA